MSIAASRVEMLASSRSPLLDAQASPKSTPGIGERGALGLVVVGCGVEAEERVEVVDAVDVGLASPHPPGVPGQDVERVEQGVAVDLPGELGEEQGAHTGPAGVDEQGADAIVGVAGQDGG